MTRLVLVGALLGALAAGCADAPVPTADAAQPPMAFVAPAPAPPVRVVTVTEVIDGDTFDAGGQRFRVLVMDSCEKGWQGWRDARDDARELLQGQTVRITQEPGVTLDRYGRVLAHVELPGGADYARLMLGRPHTGVYEGEGDASPERTEEGRRADTDGRDCGARTVRPSP